jgi:hypothetical protein
MKTMRSLAVMVIGSWISISSVIACSGAAGSPPAAVVADAGAGEASPDAGAPDAPTGVANPDAGDAGGDAADAGSPDASGDASPEASAPPGPPTLVALSVSGSEPGDGGAPITLVPAFSPDVHDYSVRCAAGTNALTVSMTASDGASSLLVQPAPSPSLPSQTLSLSVTENQAVVAAATDGAATVEYWVRCLPHDFPQLQWTAHPQAGSPPPGYYLIGTALPTTSGCYAIVLDEHGVPVWYTRSQPAGGWCVFDVDSVAPGAVSFDSVADTPAEFEVHQLSPLGTTTIAPTGLNVDLHELRRLDNGDYLVISSPLQSGVDMTGLQVTLPDGGVETLSGAQTIMTCNLVELRPDGTVVWTWKATDHFDPRADSSPILFPYGPGAGLVLDPFHCNSVDVDPTSGNLLVSAREMSSIFDIEKSTGRVLWKMGGAQASKDGAAYVAVVDPFALQHDARFQPDWSSSANGGSGHISLFDDEVPGKPSPARAVVYDVVVGAADGTPATATVDWQRAGAGPSTAMGSFRILPDGSRVIGWGLLSGAGFTEVDGAGNDLVDLTFLDGDATYRAVKVPLGAFDIAALRGSAGLP